jgi:hypothetical protein
MIWLREFKTHKGHRESAKQGMGPRRPAQGIGNRGWARAGPRRASGIGDGPAQARAGHGA